jgi:hypothetical protein
LRATLAILLELTDQREMDILRNHGYCRTGCGSGRATVRAAPGTQVLLPRPAGCDPGCRVKIVRLAVPPPVSRRPFLVASRPPRWGRPVEITARQPAGPAGVPAAWIRPEVSAKAR